MSPVIRTIFDKIVSEIHCKHTKEIDFNRQTQSLKPDKNKTWPEITEIQKKKPAKYKGEQFLLQLKMIM